jgi:lysozyme
MAGIINSIIDLSHRNPVDFQQVAGASVVGVIHKATQGVGFTDPKYTARKKEATDAGLLWGAYHFGDGSDAVAQADHFLDVVKPNAATLIALDFEPNPLKVAGPAGQTMNLAGAEAFVNRIKEKLGRFPGLYCSPGFLKQQLGSKKDSPLKNCWLWVAHYTTAAAPTVPVLWQDWRIWQYTDGKKGAQPHTVQGVGECDRDRFNGDVAALRQLWGVVAGENTGAADGAVDSTSTGG